jgi:hypothetical protein
LILLQTGPIGYTNPDFKWSAQLWPEKEDLLLIQSRLTGELRNDNWKIPHRTPRSVQAHYGTLKQEKVLSKAQTKLEHEPKLKQEENGARKASPLRHYTWTKDEDEIIREWMDIMSAGKIFKKSFPARSENGVRNRMRYLKRGSNQSRMDERTRPEAPRMSG